MRAITPSILLSAAISLSPAIAVAAGTAVPWVDLGISGGSLGVGPEADIRYPDSPLGLRLGADFLQFHTKKSLGGVSYNADVTLESAGATLDFYPLNGGLRLSLGARANGNHANVNTTPSGTIAFGGQSYSASSVGTLTGKATFNPVAPYASVGYTHSLFSNVQASFDLGAMYEGDGSFSLAGSDVAASKVAYSQYVATVTQQSMAANAAALTQAYNGYAASHGLGGLTAAQAAVARQAFIQATASQYSVGHGASYAAFYPVFHQEFTKYLNTQSSKVRSALRAAAFYPVVQIAISWRF